MRPDLFTIPGIDYGVKSFGFMMMVAFLSGAWLAMRRAARVKQNPDIVLNCAFVALFTGILGARALFVVHYWDEQFAFLPNPVWGVINIAAGGLEYYGGLIGAIVGVTAYLLWSRNSFRLYMDILAPSAMWGLAIGRIGCYLNGCCWGGLCVQPHTHEPAFPWAVHFPFGSPTLIRQWENRQVGLPADLIFTHPYDPFSPFLVGRDAFGKNPTTIDGPDSRFRKLEEEYRKAKTEKSDSAETVVLAQKVAALRNSMGGFLEAMQNASPSDPQRKYSADELQRFGKRHTSLPVHPAQLYDVINALLLSWFLSALFYRRKRHGVVLGAMMLLYPISRILMEIIRVDNPKDQLGGLTISQAVSIGVFMAGGVYIFFLYRLPQRSPRATAFVPSANAA